MDWDVCTNITIKMAMPRSESMWSSFWSGDNVAIGSDEETGLFVITVTLFEDTPKVFIAGCQLDIPLLYGLCLFR